jgi:hypothetical protein
MRLPVSLRAAKNIRTTLKPDTNRPVFAFHRNMSAIASSSKSPALDYPPESPSLLSKACLSGIQGLQSLDPARFVTRIPILCARVDPAKVAELKRHPMLRG